jgi:hypothetical protein
MIDHPDRDADEALARLSNDNDFLLVLNWLSCERERINAENDYQQNEAIFRQGQGAAQALRELSVHAASARTRAHSRRNAGNKQKPDHSQGW